MSAARWRLILNGKAADDQAVRDAVAAVRASGVSIEVRVTWEHGDGQRYVAEAVADGVETVVAGGGDGTLSEVAAALAMHPLAAAALPSLGVLPLGTANDFAAAAGIVDGPLAALELVAHTPAHPIDLLQVTADGASHWAVNLASGGFGTQVTVETHDGLKKLLGGLAYLITGMARLGRIDPIAARVRGPGFAWEGDFIALGIGNGRRAGGGQALCPDALLDDGLLDVTIVPSLEGEVAATVGAVLSEGKDAALERVAVRAQLAWVEVDAPQPFHLNLDGEPVLASSFRIACSPGRVRVHLPPGAPLLAAPPPSQPQPHPPKGHAA